MASLIALLLVLLVSPLVTKLDLDSLRHELWRLRRHTWGQPQREAQHQRWEEVLDRRWKGALTPQVYLSCCHTDENRYYTG